MLRAVLRSLLLIGLFVNLGEAAERPKVQKPKGASKPSPNIGVATMRNNDSKRPAMISGNCIKKGDKQLQCSFVQAIFVHETLGGIEQEDLFNLGIFIFRPTFTRTFDTGQWVSTEGPGGVGFGSICGVKDIVTLEPEPGHEEGPASLWTYTSHRIATNTADPLCKGVPKEAKETYSWKNPPLAIGGKKFLGMAVGFPFPEIR